MNSTVIDVSAAEPERRERPVSSLPVPTDATPAQILSMAVQRGLAPETLDKLMALQERWEANQARRAFTEAMAAFKANPPEILKNKHVKFTSERTGKVTEYDHATLGDVCNAVIKGLAEHSISHRWNLEQHENRIKVTCVLTHALGHSESASLVAPPDDSGGKNSLQAIASSVSYLERYTLLAASGLASMDMDDDGRGSEGGNEKITPEQIDILAALIKERGDMAKGLRFLKVKSLDEIPAKNFDAAVAMVKTVKVKPAKSEGGK